LQPHKNEYWLFPKITDWSAFLLRVALICRLIVQTLQGTKPKCYLISVDEKTGIQALERVQQRAPVSRSFTQRQEFEYIRHGTTTLMAAVNLADGKLIHHQLNPTRTEEDFCGFIGHTCQPLLADPEAEVILLADQLNTHLSESLVKWVARMRGFAGDLGKKGHRGILQNQLTRMAFLEEESGRIRFVFTPKHCSWLNPIENYFAKLQRHVMQKASFSSVDQLKSRITQYIHYANTCLVKPLKWKFTGFVKDKPLHNLNYQPFRS
jgi:hypothetical protein